MSNSPQRSDRLVKARLPLVPLSRAVLFPHNVLPLTQIEAFNAADLAKARKGRLKIAVVMTRADASEQNLSKLASHGTEAVVTSVMQLPSGEYGAVVRGTRRIKIAAIKKRGEKTYVDAEYIVDQPIKHTARFMATVRALKNSAVKLAHLNKTIGEETAHLLAATSDPSTLCDLILPYLSVGIDERQALLASTNLPKRVQEVLALASRELEFLKMADEIRDQVHGDIQEAHRRSYLQEQVRALKQELGEIDGSTDEIEQLEEEIDKLPLPEAVREAVMRELGRMELISPGSPEYLVSHSYLTWIKDLPWLPPLAKRPSLVKAKKQLSTDHYGLVKVKERILEYLAVMNHRGENRGEILLLSGPPGVGKTSLARSIAKALGRPFVRISLGGVKDEAEIRGHRRTYVGSMPGKIMHAIREAKSKAPVILLDEIDKIGLDQGRSDLASALLEVLDYEQNKTFVDHYLGIPYDLSNVVFIATANSLDPISEPLLDRMELVELSSYTEQEKVRIALDHLIPAVRTDLKLSKSHFELSSDAILTLIRHYTREAGVRQLRREIVSLGRKVVKSQALHKTRTTKINADLMRKWLGQPRYFDEPNDATLIPGIAIGLAYTSVGGDILYIETNKTAAADGRGRLNLTGRLGAVMKESAHAAISYLTAVAQTNPEMLAIDAATLEKSNVHLHVPDGATPKDGPSAGVAIMCAIASLFTGKPLSAKLAMTGEVTLRGLVLPVGGIREKLLAAHRYGKNKILIPYGNLHDVADLPRDVLKTLTIVPVKTMEEALREVGIMRYDSRQASKQRRHSAAARGENRIYS